MPVAVPVPEEEAIPDNEIRDAISYALDQVNNMSISGKEKTVRPSGMLTSS